MSLGQAKSDNVISDHWGLVTGLSWTHSTHGQATQRCAQLAVPKTQLIVPSSPAKPHMLIDQLRVL